MTPHTLTPRLLAGFGTLALLGAVGLVTSRPAHTAGGPIAVDVANAPLYVVSRDADSPARQPVEVTQLLLTDQTTVNLYTVPAGKRLVVEYITSTAENSNDANSYNLQVTAEQGGLHQYANFNELPDTSPYSAVSESVRLYSDPGTTVTVASYSSQKNATYIGVTLSGYLVDVP